MSEAGPLLGSTQTRMVDADWANDDGYLFLQGRLDGMINTGSYHVYPAEIEAAITSLPGITGAKVRGRTTRNWAKQ